jgi:hypothetical protein
VLSLHLPMVLPPSTIRGTWLTAFWVRITAWIDRGTPGVVKVAA